MCWISIKSRCIIQYVHFCPQFFQGITIVMNIINLEGGFSWTPWTPLWLRPWYEGRNYWGGWIGENYAMPVMYVNHYSRSSLQRYVPFYADLQNVGSVQWMWPLTVYFEIQYMRQLSPSGTPWFQGAQIKVEKFHCRYIMLFFNLCFEHTSMQLRSGPIKHI